MNVTSFVLVLSALIVLSGCEIASITGEPTIVSVGLPSGTRPQKAAPKIDPSPTPSSNPIVNPVIDPPMQNEQIGAQTIKARGMSIVLSVGPEIDALGNINTAEQPMRALIQYISNSVPSQLGSLFHFIGPGGDPVDIVPTFFAVHPDTGREVVIIFTEPIPAGSQMYVDEPGLQEPAYLDFDGPVSDWAQVQLQ